MAEQKKTSPKAKDDENALLELVLTVGEKPGYAYSDEEAMVVLRAKRRGIVRERDFKLELTETGRQWFAIKVKDVGTETTSTKLNKQSNVRLKELAKREGVQARHAIDSIIENIYNNYDSLAALAHRLGVKGEAWQVLDSLDRLVER